MHNNKKVYLLVAYTKNKRVIGAQGKIPWELSSERTRFKQICAGKKIIMGRKSFEEIGRPLPYCTIIVVSKNLKSVPQGCLLAHSLQEAFDLCEEDKDSEILVAGGEQIYEATLPFADMIYATEIYCDFEGNSYFPLINDDWNCQEEACCQEGNIKYKYVTYKKKS